MRQLRSTYLLLGLATGVLLPFSAPILADRGFSPAGIGLLLAVTSVAILLAMPAWGHLGDVIVGRRRTLQLAALVSIVAAVGFGAPLALPLVGAAFVAWYVLQAAPPVLLDSIAMRELGSERESYGRLRLLLSFSYAVAAFVVGILYDRTGYGAAYLAFGVATLAVVLSLGRAGDRPSGRRVGPRAADGPPVSSQPGTAAAVVRRRPGLRRPGLGSTGAALRAAPTVAGALAAILLASIGLLTASTFLPLRLHELGAAPSIIASSAVVSALFEIPMMLAGRRLVARVGLRGFFVIGCVMYLVATASWVIVDQPALLGRLTRAHRPRLWVVHRRLGGRARRHAAGRSAGERTGLAPIGDLGRGGAGVPVRGSRLQPARLGDVLRPGHHWPGPGRAPGLAIPAPAVVRSLPTRQTP